MRQSAISVTVDARVLGGPMDGTKRHVLELTGALAGSESLEVRALVSPWLDPTVRERLSAAGAEVLTGNHVSDLVHRPHQLNSPADLAVLAELGPRLVITHQDMIAWGSGSHFAASAAWDGYRSLTRLALASADRVVFPSAHARDQALSEHLVEAHRASVVALGVDHPVSDSLEGAPAPPAAARGIPADAELLLYLGSDFEHKNRPFALEVAAELQRRQGWTGWFVLAGEHVAHGSTRREEGELLQSNPVLREACLDLGPVSESERAWLLGRAALVIHPSSHEGFGLVPFEAAARGVPCLWAAGTSLSELLPDDEAAIVQWDAAATADRAVALMRDDAVRARNLDAIHRAAERLRWRASADKLAEIYLQTLEHAPSPAGVMLREHGLMRTGFSEDAVRLVGPGGLLPADVERPLLAVATRPALRRPLFAALRLVYRLARRRRPDRAA